MITVLDEAGQVEVFLSSFLPSEEGKRVWEVPDGERFFDSLRHIPVALRVRDFHSYTGAHGFPAMQSPIEASAFLAAPVRHRGEALGYMFLAKKEAGQAFSRTDEETLVMFAAQAALVFVNARRYRAAERARTDLEALVNTARVPAACKA